MERVIRLGMLAGVVTLVATHAGAFTVSNATLNVTCMDSEETSANAPGFAWDNISTAPALTLTATSSLPAADEGYALVAIPWSFNYLGTGYTSVSACANGYLQFGGTGSDLSNDTVPSVNAPNNIAAVFWDDLDGAALTSPVTPAGSIRSQVLGLAPNRRLVISWISWRRWAQPTTSFTFQAALFEQGNAIRFQYQTMSSGTSTTPYGSGASTTIGIENAAATQGIQYLYGTTATSPTYTPAGNSVYNGLAVGFFATGTTPPWVAAPPPPPPPPGGGGTPASQGSDDDDRTHRLCGGGAAAGAGLAGLALAFAMLLGLAARR